MSLLSGGGAPPPDGTPPPSFVLPEFDVNSDAQALTAFDRAHKHVINLGGKGSGKTATHRLWALDRGTWDTGQLHGIFTNTEKQLKEGVFFELFENLPSYGVQCDYNKNPPADWKAYWRLRGTPIPPVTDYRGIFYTSQGLHALCGTLSKQSYTQFETLQFATLRIEEIPALQLAALKSILSRLRCGKGKQCPALGHRHQAHLFGNPPVGGAHPWLFDWLDTLEEGSKRLYHVLAAGETCDGCYFESREGRQIPREHGPQLNHRQWPLLRAGVGGAKAPDAPPSGTILIKSKTSDNRANLNEGYEDDIAMNSDKATADAWLSGELVREVNAGCYYNFSDANVREVAYDPNRTLYVGVDINIEPRVAVLAHPLLQGEYPSDWHIPGVEQIGVFGEFFSLGGMSDRAFAEAMMRGERGVGDAGYADERLRGLPENWLGLAQHRGPIIFYGDAEGHRRSAHADNLESSWLIMQQTFRSGIPGEKIKGLPKWSIDVPQNNPPARARIHAVCAKLSNALTNKPSLSIAPRCRHTIKDCELVVYDENGLAEREWRLGVEMFRTHCMAGVGYIVCARSPFGRDASDEVPMPRMSVPRFEEPRLTS